MHIMQLVSGTEAMNGAMVHCVQLTQRLVERGHRITFVCTPNSGSREYVKHLPIEIIASDQHRWPTDELRRIAAIVRQQNVDCLHAHLSRAQFFAVLLKQWTGVPCVATAHCSNFKLHRMFNDFVIANSESNRRIQMRKNLVRSSRIETVNYPVDLIHRELPTAEQRREVRRSLGADDHTRLVGLVGNVCHRKGQDTLLRAMPLLLKRHERLRVAFVGNPFEGYVEQMKTLADALGVNHAVEWAGFRDDIPQVMAALDVCVAPSRSEAFGLTAVEALAMGTPVVVSRVGGLRGHDASWRVRRVDSGRAAAAGSKLPAYKSTGTVMVRRR